MKPVNNVACYFLASSGNIKSKVVLITKLILTIKSLNTLLKILIFDDEIVEIT